MDKIYLRYRMEGHCAIEITACYEKVFRKSSPVMFAFSEENEFLRVCFEDEIYSDKSPRQILNRLEELIKNKVHEIPSSRDVLAFMGDIDNDPKYRTNERHFTFQKLTPQSIKGESTQDFIKRADTIDERNKKLHSMLLPIYREYVKKLHEKQNI